MMKKRKDSKYQEQEKKITADVVEPTTAKHSCGDGRSTLCAAIAVATDAG